MPVILSNRGNYKDLVTFRKATVIYDLTYFFATRFLDPKDRTVDQMIQAARSGKQNIAEGVAASSTNAETEIKLVNVAKASLKELLTDYEDYLRTRGHRQWEKGSREYEYMRNLGREHDDSEFFMGLAATRPPETIANMAIILLAQEDYLLFRQLKALEEQLQRDGDLHVRLKFEAKEIKSRLRDQETLEAMKIKDRDQRRKELWRLKGKWGY